MKHENVDEQQPTWPSDYIFVKQSHVRYKIVNAQQKKWGCGGRTTKKKVQLESHIKCTSRF
jgi:hypothetical protein